MHPVTTSISAKFSFVILFAVLFGFSAPASAQVNVQKVGCSEEKSGSPISITTTNDVAAGNALLVAAVNEDGTGNFLVDISGGGNSQTIPQQYSYTGSSFDGHFVHADFDAQSWPSGSTITLNPNSAGPTNNASFCAIEISGLQSSNVIDGTNGNYNQSLNLNMFSGSVSTTQANVLLLGIHHWIDGSQKATPTATGFSVAAENDNATNTNDSNVEGNLMLATKQVSSTGSYTTEAFLEFQDYWNASILALKVQQNATPTFTAGASTSLTIDEDAAATSLSSQLQVDDPDAGQTLEWTVSAAPSNGTLSGFPTTASSGTGVQPSGLTYEPNANFNGSDAFDVQVSDGNGGSATITVNVTVNAINDSPTISGNLGISVNEGSAVTLSSTDLEADDPDDGASALTFSITSGPSNGSIEVNGSGATSFTEAALNNGNVEYVHDGSETTADDFDVELADDDGATSSTKTVNVTISAQNDAPTISSLPDQTINEDGTLNSLSLTVDDAETSDLSTLTLSGSSDNTTLVPNGNVSFTGPDASGNASITVQPASNESGTATITVTVDDGSGNNNTASEQFTLTVNAVPDLAITDGASSNLDFTADVSAGTDNNAVGIFELSAGQNGATLSDVTITNNSPGVSGITNARLYLSSDQTLVPGEDQQVASFDVTDGSAEEEFDFTGIGTSVPTSGYYAILAIDVASGASASGVQFFLDQTNDLAVSSGEIATVNGNSQSTFSALALSNGATALPVELARFDATTNQAGGSKAVTLQWKTVSETENAGFDIQRRRAETPIVTPSRQDGATASSDLEENWQTVGSVDGAGTTAEAQSYRFEDTDVPYDADSLIYRLKQLDTDGTVSYSEPITVARSTVQQVQLLGTHPNPARSQATVRYAMPEGSSEGLTLRLYDALGRQVRTVPAAAEAGRHTIRLDTGQLPSGVYFLRLQAGTSVKTQKLTVVQ